MTTTAHERQRAYVDSLAKQKFPYNLVAGAAFIRGIRNVGYKHTGTALDELADNSLEAGASLVHIAFGFDGSKSAKPQQLAVIDNGVGMIPEMLRAAVMWGGTDREGSRTGLGRFGYGLPSACMSQGKRFEVYSKTAGNGWHMAYLDVDEIERGDHTNDQGVIVIPPAKPADLPRWVKAYVAKHLPGELDSGTIVVIDKLDGLDWTTANGLQDNLLRHLGVTYHKLRANMDMYVDGVRCDPIDPLFLTPGYRWFDLDAQRARALDPLIIEVKDKDSREPMGTITVRFSYMPPTFASKDPGKDAVRTNQNERFSILKEYNGFIICRMGRVIHVVRSSPLTTFQNNDRYIKVEIDFDARLDDEFNVPTNKQRVDVSDRIWRILEEQGLLKALEQLRRKFKEEKAERAVVADTKAGERRPSEIAMERASMLDSRPSTEQENKRREEGARRLRQEAERRASETGKSVTDAEREIEAENAGRSYRVGKESVPSGVFFRVEQIGGTKTLFLNTASRFFKEIYAGPESTPGVRFSLEVLLFAIGDRILDSKEELRDIYANEVPEWSKKLEFALGQLGVHIATVSDDDEQLASEVQETAAEVHEPEPAS